MEDPSGNEEPGQSDDNSKHPEEDGDGRLERREAEDGQAEHGQENDDKVHVRRETPQGLVVSNVLDEGLVITLVILSELDDVSGVADERHAPSRPEIRAGEGNREASNYKRLRNLFGEVGRVLDNRVRHNHKEAEAAGQTQETSHHLPNLGQGPQNWNGPDNPGRRPERVIFLKQFVSREARGLVVGTGRRGGRVVAAVARPPRSTWACNSSSKQTHLRHIVVSIGQKMDWAIPKQQEAGG